MACRVHTTQRTRRILCDNYCSLWRFLRNIFFPLFTFPSVDKRVKRKIVQQIVLYVPSDGFLRINERTSATPIYYFQRHHIIVAGIRYVWQSVIFAFACFSWATMPSLPEIVMCLLWASKLFVSIISINLYFNQHLTTSNYSSSSFLSFFFFCCCLRHRCV